MGNTDSFNDDTYPPENTEPFSREKGPGSRENPVRFKAQDYERLRSRCLRDEQLFQDPLFPAEPESLGKGINSNIEWIRASALFRKPHFFVNSVSTTDICQGQLGDCWFLAAMSSLTLDEQHFSYVVPSDQSFQKLYAGIFRFRFWQYGRWVEVVVDDRLPTLQKRLVFTRSSSRNELWSALLEKAYAKMHGSYSSLQGGNVSEAMEDFTGGIAVSIEMSSTTPDKLWVLVKGALTKQTLVSCAIEVHNPQDVEKDNGLGLMYAHAYAIMEADTVKQGQSSIRLFRLRNPWGHREYNGPWSDRSPKWKSVSDEEKARLKLKIKEDGEFWIPANILVENFTRMELCSFNPLCQHSADCTWAITCYEGMWISGVSAGGSYSKGTFWTNPQYRLKLLEEDDDPVDEKPSCTISVELLQKYGRRKEKIDFHYIAFSIFAIPAENQSSHFGRKFFRRQNPVFHTGNYINSRAVSRRLQLSPGEYVIVPSTFDKNKEGEFFLRIFTKRNNVSRENSITTTAFNPQIDWTTIDASNTEGIMLHLLRNTESQNNNLSASEFMELFNSASPEKYHLTLETCCSLVFAVNAPGQQGWLNSQEAKQLVMHLKKLQDIFDQFLDTDTGLMDSIDLRPALSLVEFELDSKVHQQLWLRHQTSTNMLCFSQFISCVAKLQKLFDIFERTKSSGPKSIDEWLLLFIGI